MREPSEAHKVTCGQRLRALRGFMVGRSLLRTGPCTHELSRLWWTELWCAQLRSSYRFHPSTRPQFLLLHRNREVRPPSLSFVQPRALSPYVLSFISAVSAPERRFDTLSAAPSPLEAFRPRPVVITLGSHVCSSLGQLKPSSISVLPLLDPFDYHTELNESLDTHIQQQFTLSR